LSRHNRTSDGAAEASLLVPFLNRGFLLEHQKGSERQSAGHFWCVDVGAQFVES